jgi:hypothetical protein
MNSKKKIPTFFKKQILQNKKQLNSISFDFITNYFYILNLNSIGFDNKEILFRNKLLKLHNFRYKA